MRTRLLTIALLTLLAMPVSVWAADPVYIQSKVGSNSAVGAPATTFTGAVTAGSVVVVLVYNAASSSAGAATVVDNKVGNVYARVESHGLTVDGDFVELWWAYINNGGTSFTVTATFSGTDTGRMDVIEVGPCAPTPLDAHTNGYNASSTSPASGTITTSASVKTVAVGVYGTDTTTPGLTAGSGWSGPDFEGSFRGAIHKDAIAPSTVINANGTFGAAEEWTMLVASFKGIAVAAGAKSRLTLLGVGGR